MGREDIKDCKDDNEYCEAWEKSGECKRNPAFMLKSCRKSCKECGIGNCSCSDFINNQDYGNCTNAVDGDRKCYVNQPSTCKDLKRSKQYKGLMFSHEACKIRA